MYAVSASLWQQAGYNLLFYSLAVEREALYCHCSGGALLILLFIEELGWH